jgi:spore coat protein A
MMRPEQWDIINLTGDAHPIHLHLVQFQILNRQTFNIGLDPNDVPLPNGYRYLYDQSFPTKQFEPFNGPPMPYATVNEAGAIGGNPDVTPFLKDPDTGIPYPIEAPANWETGWKDMIKVMPGQVARIIVRFAPQNCRIDEVKAGENKFPFDPTVGPGYAWHCHIVDHEDNEMMRPYTPVKGYSRKDDHKDYNDHEKNEDNDNNR